MGASEIILIGQDLSFPDNKFYSSGVKHATKDEMNSQLDNLTIRVPNVDGGENPTTEYMRNILDDMELQIKLVSLNDGVKFINASKHGAAISGTEYIPFDTLIDRLLNLPDHKIEIGNYLTELCEDEKLERLNILKLKFEETEQSIQSYGNHLHQMVVLLDKFSLELQTDNIDFISNTLVEINEIWGNLTTQKIFEAIYSFMMKHHINNYMKHVPEIVETKDIVEKSKLIVTYLGKLVKEMDEFTPRLLEILESSREKLEKGIVEITHN
ncbi:hypothetical protein D3C77_493200 [compost metagenome]